jgi:hypothetical protein
VLVVVDDAHSLESHETAVGVGIDDFCTHLCDWGSVDGWCSGDRRVRDVEVVVVAVGSAKVGIEIGELLLERRNTGGEFAGVE